MTERSKKMLQWGLLAVALVFVAVGILRAEQETVFLKAVNICLECIGIG